jgi:antirestriction protein ArdC
MKQDIYDKVTERVINGLKDKGMAWFRPWEGSGGLAPINRATGRPYKGMNVFFLFAEMDDKKYEHNEWLTYKQASQLGGQVRKGETSTMVIFWNIFFKGEDKKIYKKESDIPVGMAYEKLFSLRSYNVFNIAQCDDIEPRREPVSAGNDSTPIERADAIYEKFKGRPTLEQGGDRAYYRPATHHVQMPRMETFVSADDYYKVLFHELTHSTGHESLLNRKTLVDMNSFGDENYSKEELVAEVGAEFLTGIVGLSPKSDHTNSQAYINGWISKIGNDKKFLVSACTQAMKAVDCILGD